MASLSGFRFCFGSFQGVVRLLFAWWLLGGRLESVAAPVDRDNLGVMEQAVEYRAGGGHIAEQFAPFFNRPRRWIVLPAGTNCSTIAANHFAFRCSAGVSSLYGSRSPTLRSSNKLRFSRDAIGDLLAQKRHTRPPMPPAAQEMPSRLLGTPASHCRCRARRRVYPR